MPNNAVTRLTHIDEARKCLQSLDKESEAARIINALIATIERLTRESKIDQERIATEQELKQQGIDVIRSLREQLQIVEQRASLAAGIAYEQAAKEICPLCREPDSQKPFEYQADPKPTYWHGNVECRASKIWLLRYQNAAIDAKRERA